MSQRLIYALTVTILAKHFIKKSNSDKETLKENNTNLFSQFPRFCVTDTNVRKCFMVTERGKIDLRTDDLQNKNRQR